MGDIGNVPPTASGGAVAAKDDTVTKVATATALDFTDTGSLQFVVTDMGSGVAKVEGNVLAAGGPPTGAAGGDLAGTYPNPTIGTNKVTSAKFRQSAARSVVGVTGNATADVADIAGAGAGTVPIDSGSALAFGVLTRLLQNVSLEGDISPAQITANQNDYNPASLATAAILRLDEDAARSITGIAGGADGRVLGLFNIGAFNLTLSDASASSSAANRFDMGGDLVLLPKHGALIWYDSTSSRWRLLSRAFPFTAAPIVTLTAGAGLTGGGDTSANRTFDIAAADGTITVNADSIQVATNGVANANLRQSGALAVVGRSANSTGNVADIQATAASDGVLRESGSVLGFGTVATAGIANDAITDAKLRNSGALSVIGRSANSSGDPGDISATAATDAVLRENGSTIGFGTIATGGIANNAVTDAKLRQGVARSVVGVTGNATANVADIQGTADQVLRVNGGGTALAFGTVAAGGIASDAVTTVKILDANVTDSKLANMGALTVKGRSANSSGVPADIAASTDGDILRRKGTTLGFGRALPVVVTLTDAATISVDASLIGIGDSFTVTLGGNRTLGAPSNPTNGQWMCIAVVQDGTGSRTLTLTTGAGGYRATELSLTLTLSTAAGKIDYLLFRYHSGDNRWDLMDFRKAA